MHPHQKLYVVTRSDLSPGAQAVQSGHALVGYGLEYPDIFRVWHLESNYLCYLVVPCEEALEALCIEAKYRGIQYFAFREPDFGDALTAIALDPTIHSTRLCSDLPLALKT